MENSEVFPYTFSLNKHKINEEIERHESMSRMNANLAQSRANPVHFRTQNNPVKSYARIPKGKNGRETTEKQLKRQRIDVLKRLVKQKNIFLWLGRVSKTRRILSRENGRPKIFSKNGMFLTKAGGLESPQFILRTILVITLHKLHHRHSESLSLRFSETKIHGHLSIKAFAFLSPCPKLVDLLICITIKRIPQVPVNAMSTPMCRNVPRRPCGNNRRHLGLERIPYQCPTFPRTKVRKRVNPPHIGDSK